MSLADLLTFGFYSEEEGAIAEQFNTLFVHLILIQVTYNIQNDHTFTTVYIYCHVCFNIIYMYFKSEHVSIAVPSVVHLLLPTGHGWRWG